MRYRIEIDKPALKFLLRQPPEQRERLLKAIYKLPDLGDVRPMAGRANTYRLRVGTYRVIYTIEDAVLVVRVLAVGNRGGIYK